MSVDTQVQTGAFRITTVDASGDMPRPDYELILGGDSAPNVTIESMGRVREGVQLQSGTVAVGRVIRFRVVPQDLSSPWQEGSFIETGRVSSIRRRLAS